MSSDVLDKPSKLKAWILALRPQTLLMGIMPITTGTVLGLHYAAAFHWIAMLSALLSGLFIQLSVNLFNDALDFKKGADNSSRLGFKRVTQQGWLTSKEVLWGGYTCIGLAFLTGIPMVLQGGIYFLASIAVASILSYCYTGGPLSLAYHGMGEIFVILFFGFVSVIVGFYLQAEMITKGALLAGAQLGLLSAVVLSINNLRDIESDTKAHKKTLAVLFGKTFARMEITLMILLPYFLNLFWGELGFFKAGLLPLVSLPLGFTLIRCIWFYEPSKIYNTFFGLAALLNFLFALFLSIGFWI